MLERQSSKTIRILDLVVSLRCAVGLRPLDRPPTDDLPGHLAASLEVAGLNVRGWIAWAVAGLPLFAGERLPSMATAVLTAKRTLATLAMDDQGGSVSHAAAVLSTGRRCIKRTLEGADCYPWRDPIDRNPPTDAGVWFGPRYEDEGGEAI